MSAKAHMVSFNELSSEEQAAVREAQRERKQRKAQAREKWAAGKETEREVSRNAPSPGCELLAAAADYPDRISSDSYFGACPGGRFRDPSLSPTAQSLALLLQLLEVEGREEQELNTCCYFQFSGTEDDLWDATFNARLAFEGFFTITSYSHRLRAPEPLPELQPFYGVLTWPNFRAAKPVRAHISKMRRRLQEEDADEADTAVSEKGQINGGRRKQRRLRVVDCEDRHECWRKLEAYHRAKNGSNWLTERYFNMLITASDNPRINFCMHTICLIEDGEGTAAATIVAGEVGFSIGQVYTSLSGWTAERSPEALGTTQLVLLGLWLQRKGYAFWSLGHCYSPELEYKRALGHRIYPRWDFVRLLRRYRGVWTRDCANCGALETAPDKRHQACGRCWAVYYCGRQCQLAHWKAKPLGHKQVCVDAAQVAGLRPLGVTDAVGGTTGSSGAFKPIALGESASAADLLEGTT